MTTTALPPPPATRKLLSLSELAALLGISKPQIYRLMESDEHFPKPIRIGPRGVRFRPEAVEAYMEKLAEISA